MRKSAKELQRFEFRGKYYRLPTAASLTDAQIAGWTDSEYEKQVQLFGGHVKKAVAALEAKAKADREMREAQAKLDRQREQKERDEARRLGVEAMARQREKEKEEEDKKKQKALAERKEREEVGQERQGGKRRRKGKKERKGEVDPGVKEEMRQRQIEEELEAEEEAREKSDWAPLVETWRRHTKERAQAGVQVDPNNLVFAETPGLDGMWEEAVKRWGEGKAKALRGKRTRDDKRRYDSEKRDAVAAAQR